MVRNIPSFIFDIDGVLLRGPAVLPAAIRAIKRLYDQGTGWRFPVAFMTNGGGMLEADKAAELSEKLDAHVSEEQVILSHTPMRDLADELADRPVLLSGRGKLSEVAASYGFRKTIHTSEIARAFPSAVPFSPPPLATSVRCRVMDEGYGTSNLPIESILVMNDPSDWYADAQLIVDCLQSGGLLDGSEHSEGSNLQMPRLYFSNPDLVWASDFGRNRFGQGSFALIVETLYARTSSAAADSSPPPPLRPHYFGKPNAAPYRVAERILMRQSEAMGLGSNLTGGIYAIGDNPAADVLGANRAGSPWISCLVKTGVYRGGKPSSIPSILVDDVAGAVDAALHRSRMEHWHSLR